jgi:L-fuconolactonase
MTRKAWSDQVIEAAIEPDLPIVDAHHHIWENLPYPPFDPYTEEDLFTDMATSGHNIRATVFVDSHTSYRSDGPEQLRVVGETEYADRVATLADERGAPIEGACAAILPSANLMLGTAVGEVLDAHAAVTTRFRGIRHMTAFDQDVPASAGTGAGVMMQPAFREGFGELARRGLIFEAWLLQSQLSEVIDLARSFPDTIIVLNHLGGPLGIGRFAEHREDAFAAWRADMAILATSTNVRVKAGGLNMGLAGVDAIQRDTPFTSEEMAAVQRDLFLTAIDLFGPSRCMFESNASIDTYAAGYGILWNAFKRISKGYSSDERARLFYGTAAETYRIKTR